VESTSVNSLGGEAVDNAGDADHTGDTATYTAQPFAEYYVGDGGLDGDVDEDELIEDSDDEEDENGDTSEGIEYGSHPSHRDNEDMYVHRFLAHSRG